ncbi:MAG: nicotinate phosphoribosyltransferase [Nitrososphaerales archaeon]
MRDIKDRLFWLAKEDEVKRAETTDMYFQYAVEVLRKKNVDPEVVMEVYARRMPEDGGWGVVTGIYEVAKLLEGFPLGVKAMEEGEVFLSRPDSAIYEPVMQITGRYTDLALHENPILGLLCSSSGVSTKAARVKLAAGDKVVLSFGTRRAHPALAPMIERAAYIGGVDGLSNILAGRLVGKEAQGTMPHAMILCFGDQVAAWKAFDEVMPPEVPRVALVDTFSDEKTEAVNAFEALGERLSAVRLDTPSSRRGDWRAIIDEVRWELNIRGGKKVKIFLSGGLDEKTVADLADIADGFGVGTSISSAPAVDFNAKIVEVKQDGDTIYRAKRGDLGGRKQVYRRRGSFEDVVTMASNPPPDGFEPLLSDLLVDGKIVRRFKDIEEIRAATVRKVRSLAEAEGTLSWG